MTTTRNREKKVDTDTLKTDSAGLSVTTSTLSLAKKLLLAALSHDIDRSQRCMNTYVQRYIDAQLPYTTNP